MNFLSLAALEYADLVRFPNKNELASWRSRYVGPCVAPLALIPAGLSDDVLNLNSGRTFPGATEFALYFDAAL